PSQAWSASGSSRSPPRSLSPAEPADVPVPTVLPARSLVRGAARDGAGDARGGGGAGMHRVDRLSGAGRTGAVVHHPDGSIGGAALLLAGESARAAVAEPGRQPGIGARRGGLLPLAGRDRCGSRAGRLPRGRGDVRAALPASAGWGG